MSKRRSLCAPNYYSVLTLGQFAQVQPCAIKRKGLKNGFAVMKNDGVKKRRPKQNGAKKHSEYEKE